MCNTCFNMFSRSKNSFLILFKLKMMFIFKMIQKNILMNIDRWCYMSLYIPPITSISNKLFYIIYNMQVHIGTGLRSRLFDLVKYYSICLVHIWPFTG